MNLSLDGLRNMIQQSGQQELIINIICIAGILIAIANCFAGYRLLRVWIALLGFGLGAALGWYVSSFFTDSAAIQACAVLAAAIAGAILTRHFIDIGMVLLCAAMAFSFSYYLLLYLFGYSNVRAYMLTAAVISLLCGLLAHLLRKPVIIIITALCGAYTAWSSASSMLKLYYNQQFYWGAIAVLAAAGILVQFLFVSRKQS